MPRSKSVSLMGGMVGVGPAAAGASVAGAAVAGSAVGCVLPPAGAWVLVAGTAAGWPEVAVTWAIATSGTSEGDWVVVISVMVVPLLVVMLTGARPRVVLAALAAMPVAA